jgi:hypothetical protein
LRTLPLLLVGLVFGVLLPAESAEAQTPRPPASSKSKQLYDGVWASSPKHCRDEDGVERMLAQGDRFTWYETRCRARDIKAVDGKAVDGKVWTMRMSCEGEGQRFRARPRLSLPTPDRLVFESSPVGQAKRDAYVRCKNFGAR